MTNEQLIALNKKELTDKARSLGVANPGGMRKEELVKAIVKAEKKLEKAKERQQTKESPNKETKSSRPAADKSPKAAPKTVEKTPEPAKPAKPAATANGKHAAKTKTAVPATTNGTPSTKPVSKNGTHKAAKAIEHDDEDDDDFTGEEEVASSKFDNGPPAGSNAKNPKDLPSGYQKDRVVAAVIDPYWLHCYWELTQQSVQRAEAAMGPDWHSCKPILRLLDVSAQDTTSTAESIVKDIDLHGGATNWYIQVDQPPRSYRIDIGYVSRRGQFFQICRSDIITTPKAGVSEVVEGSWSMDEKQAERILAMSTGFDPNGNGSSLELKRFFEERFRRPLGSSPISGSGGSLFTTGKDRKFFFEIKAELTIYGRTEAGSKVTLQGEPMVLDNQGRFAMRYSLPDGRQIIPAVATSGDGIEERTIVLAIERNTKQLEPMIHDGMGDENR
jgi:hypothetical protein